MSDMPQYNGWTAARRWMVLLLAIAFLALAVTIEQSRADAACKANPWVASCLENAAAKQLRCLEDPYRPEC